MRTAQRTDLARLVSLGVGDVDAWGHGQFAAEFDLPVSRILVLEGRAPDAPSGPNIILGCVVAWSIVDETQILNVVVHPVARRRGIGAMLVARVIAEARVHGHKQVVLEVRADNEPAKHLYAQLGFVHSGLRLSYYAQSGADALLMTHHLGL